MCMFCCLCAVPSGYPDSIIVEPLSPNEIRVQWEPVPLIDRNGIITHYEVVFNQSTIDTLRQSDSSFNDTELSATVGPLQPFIDYTLSVRAFTSVGAGPFNPTSLIAMSDPSGSYYTSIHIVWSCIPTSLAYYMPLQAYLYIFYVWGLNFLFRLSDHELAHDSAYIIAKGSTQ